MPEIAAHIAGMPGSGVRHILELALQRPGTIILAVGEPGEAVAEPTRRAGADAWLSGQTRYTAIGGIPALRRAIADKLARDNAVRVDSDDVWVADAAAHYRANFAAAAALLDARGIRYLTLTGAFYLWIDLGHATGGDVGAWAERFLYEEGVAVAPGTAFGAGGEGWIRVCLASDAAELLAGLGRLPAP